MRLGRTTGAALAATLLAAIASLTSAPAASAAVVPIFNPQTGTLTVMGDPGDNEIVIGRDALGVITVNGKVPPAGGAFPTVFNVKSMTVFGLSGDDVLRLDEASGPLPGAQLFGGSGRDLVVGGAGADALHGQDGDDRLQGGAGDDFVLGQAGDDALNGGDGRDSLFGSVGVDTADGDRGDDTIALGEGNDLAVWDPGDGSDRLDGEPGFDAFQFRGSGADERFRFSREGTRARLTRDVGAVAIDAGGVERIDAEPVGGNDTLTVGDLGGTLVQELRVDLEAVRGGGAPDAGRDRLALDGTAGDDLVSVFGQAGDLFVLGLPAFVTVQRADATRDGLAVNTVAGDDRVEAGSVAAGAVGLVADGGSGDDTLFGTNGGDELLGGDGNDFVDGGRGGDTALLGAGDDTYLSRRGDGADQVAGEGGIDRVELSGSSAGEQFRAAASGGLARLTVGADSVDGHQVEALRIVSFGGADTVTVDDLSSVGVTDVAADLTDFGVPGGQADVVVVNGTAGADRIGATDSVGAVEVGGLAARIRLTGAEPAGDRLDIRAGDGPDVIDTTRLSRERIRYRGDGQAGDDVLRAGPGDDVLDGGPGLDTLLGGAGEDVLLNGERVQDG